MDNIQIPQDKLNQLASAGVSKLASKIGLKDPGSLALAQSLGQKGAGMLGKLAGKKLGKFRKLVGFKTGGLIVMQDSSAPAKRGRGRPKGSVAPVKKRGPGRPKGSKNKK